MTETLDATVPRALGFRLEAVLKRVCDRGWSIVTAESCTGGLVGAAITDIDGLGRALDCSFVTYSDQSKTRLLSVDPDLIARHGAVSEAVARAMAQAALNRSGADVAVSVTGFAGPAGPDDEEGLVHFALAQTDRPTRHVVRHYGAIGRGPTRLACLSESVALLEAALADTRPD